MTFRPDCTDTEFTAWLEMVASEDELRDAYLTLEQKRSHLWTRGHLDSFRRNRYELDAALRRSPGPHQVPHRLWECTRRSYCR